MPRYEIRNTSNSALTYVEGDLPLDLMLTQAAGTYRARAMSAEEATNIVVPTLTAGTIVQTSPAIGDTLTVTGSNAPAGATFLWQVDTGGGFGAAGGTNNAASYDTTGRPAGDYRRGVSTAGQSMVYTPAVAVGAASAGVTITALNSGATISATNGAGSFDSNYSVPGVVAGERLIIAYFGNSSNIDVTSGAIDPAGTNAALTRREFTLRASGPNVYLFDGVAGATGTVTVTLTGATTRPGRVIVAFRAGSASFKEVVKNDTNNGGGVVNFASTTSGGEGFVVLAMGNNNTATWTDVLENVTVETPFLYDSRNCFWGSSDNVASGIAAVDMSFVGSASVCTYITAVYQ
jgi:hypothetical protein